MALVLRDKSATQTVRIGAMALAVALSVHSGHGQVSRARQHAYRGAATVSVATLQVPDQAWKHFEKARALALKHQAAESERESGKALAIAPFFAAAHLLQASQQLLLRDYVGVIQNVAEARKTEPDGQWAGVILAAAFNGQRRFDEAMTELHALPPDEAEKWQARYEESRAAIGLRDEETALKLTAEVLVDAPKECKDAILLRANALMLAHHWSEAKESLTEYLAMPGPQPHEEQVQQAIANVEARMRAEQPVNLASR